MWIKQNWYTILAFTIYQSKIYIKTISRRLRVEVFIISIQRQEMYSRLELSHPNTTSSIWWVHSCQSQKKVGHGQSMCIPKADKSQKNTKLLTSENLRSNSVMGTLTLWWTVCQCIEKRAFERAEASGERSELHEALCCISDPRDGILP